MTLSRRDMAAMRLALECVRAEGEPEFGALMLCPGETSAAYLLCRSLALAGYPYHHDRMRVLRARLALYLRAALRADAGDCGPMTCSEGHDTSYLDERIIGGVVEVWCMECEGWKPSHGARRLVTAWSNEPYTGPTYTVSEPRTWSGAPAHRSAT